MSSEIVPGSSVVPDEAESVADNHPGLDSFEQLQVLWRSRVSSTSATRFGIVDFTPPRMVDFELGRMEARDEVILREREVSKD